MSRLFFVLAVSLASLVTSVLAPGQTLVAPVAAATTAASGAGVQVQLGPEERVVGPTSMMDSPYFAELNSAGRLVAYLSNKTTYAYAASNTRLMQPRVALTRGPAGSFDACGAWLNSVHQVNGSHWVGWYHAEGPGSGMNGVCQDGHNIWRIAFAESWNGGLSWTKPGYRANPTSTSPGNLVISQPAGLLAPAAAGTQAGNPRVIQAGGYLYALYQATGTGATYSGPSHGVNIARSKLSDLGRPKTWHKYYCTSFLGLTPANCSWSTFQNGVGGKSSSVTNLPAAARFISWNTYLGRYVGLQASGRSGFSLRFSQGNNLLAWPSASSIYPAVSTGSDRSVDDWVGRNATSKQLYGYPSVVGAYGGSAATGRIFYLYYMKIFPGDSFGHRYLFRRRVTLVKTTAAYNRVQLTTYVDAKGRRRSTTEQPKPRAYRAHGSAGNLLTTARAGWNPVFECASGHGDAFLQVSACAPGHPAVRRVGWISPRHTAVASVPIYRCYDSGRRRHFASRSKRCSGARFEYRLGFGLPTLR